MRVSWGRERDLKMRTEILILYEVFTLLQNRDKLSDPSKLLLIWRFLALAR
jgi:hypothetical protein